MNKIDPYTFEVIEYTMDERGPPMGPETDARAGQFAVDYNRQAVFENGSVTEYYLSDKEAEAVFKELEHLKPEGYNKPKSDKQRWIEEHGLTEHLADLLQEYLDEVMKKHMLTFEQYLRAEKLALEEAKTMCENPDKPMWNHTPSARQQRREKYKSHNRALLVETPKETVVEKGTYLPPSSQDEKISSAIGKAVRHVERISKREKIMADRVERVNLFITSLRRELGYIADTLSVGMASRLSGQLTRRELWYEPGTLNINLTGVYGMDYNRETIQRWLDGANKQRNSTEAARFQIEGDLEELERGLTGCFAACEDAKRINQEGSLVASELVVLFE